MPANTAPIFSKFGDIQGGVVIKDPANDYTGQGLANAVVFAADPTNGGYVQRLRFKPVGTNVATLARIYINNGKSRFTQTVAAPATPSLVAATTGGTLQAATYFVKIVALDMLGGISVLSGEASVVTTTATSTFTASWTAVAGAASYRVYVGLLTNGQDLYFETTDTTLTVQNLTSGKTGGTNTLVNNWLYGEYSLPATTASIINAQVDYEYVLGFALPPGGRILVGLQTAVASGWSVSGIGGVY